MASGPGPKGKPPAPAQPPASWSPFLDPPQLPGRAPGSLVVPLASPLHFSPGVADTDQLLQASCTFDLKMGYGEQRGGCGVQVRPGGTQSQSTPSMSQEVSGLCYWGGGHERGLGLDPRHSLLLGVDHSGGSSPWQKL